MVDHSRDPTAALAKALTAPDIRDQTLQRVGRAGMVTAMPILEIEVIILTDAQRRVVKKPRLTERKAGASWVAKQATPARPPVHISKRFALNWDSEQSPRAAVGERGGFSHHGGEACLMPPAE